MRMASEDYYQKFQGPKLLALTISGASGMIGLWESTIVPSLDSFPVDLVHSVPGLGVGPAAHVVLEGAVTVRRGCNLRRSWKSIMN